MHTLALIQRRADDPREVSRIARGQERELRSWLYGTAAAAAVDQQFSAAMQAVAAEVEDAYAVTVETVVVGDVGLDESTHALVAATREALLNAAKHAEVTKISPYAEVAAGAEGISVYVRDRGVGFELATVPADRHGVHHSIIERMRLAGFVLDAFTYGDPAASSDGELDMLTAREREVMRLLAGGMPIKRSQQSCSSRSRR